MRLRHVGLAALLFTLAACGAQSVAAISATSTSSAIINGANGSGALDPGSAQAELLARVDAIQAAVTAWKSAPDLKSVKAAAETARNLVVGPHGPGYGDADGDGTISGAAMIGLLPGLGGQLGLADAGTPNSCVTAQVLGGSWADPAARWKTAQDDVAAWTKTNNPFPGLMSQPQRIFGWASLTLASDSLSDAHGFAGDAQLHVDATRAAAQKCRSADLHYLPVTGSAWFSDAVETITPRTGTVFCVCLIGVMPLSVDDRLCCGSRSR